MLVKLCRFISLFMGPHPHVISHLLMPAGPSWAESCLSAGVHLIPKSPLCPFLGPWSVYALNNKSKLCIISRQSDSDHHHHQQYRHSPLRGKSDQMAQQRRRRRAWDYRESSFRHNISEFIKFQYTISEVTSKFQFFGKQNTRPSRNERSPLVHSSPRNQKTKSFHAEKLANCYASSSPLLLLVLRRLPFFVLSHLNDWLFGKCA